MLSSLLYCSQHLQFNQLWVLNFATLHILIFCLGYLKGCAALVIIGVLTDFFGTMLTCFGLKSTDPNKKYKYYRVAIYALILAGVYFFSSAAVKMNLVRYTHEYAILKL